MIGLALVTVVAVLGGALRNSTQGAVRDQVAADYVVTSQNGFDPFPAAAGDAVAAAPGVELASSVRFDQALADGTEGDVTGVDVRTISTFYDFAWTDGSDASLGELGADGALVTKSFADDRDLALGSRFPVETASGQKIDLVVRGIYDPSDLAALLGKVTISQQAFDAAFPRPRNLFTFVDVGDGASVSRTRANRRALPGREAAHRVGLRDEPDQGVLDDPESPLRPARLLGRREPVRHGQHARPVGVREDARARNASGSRDDPPAGEANDPPRERHHGADRRCARASRSGSSCRSS